MSARDRGIVEKVTAWFATPGTARELPWRTRPRDPYIALVSEIMLQQTQASRVAERLPLFLRTFPDVRRLARAPESRILAAWSGLGYYRRARLLHAAAKEVVAHFDGVVPRDVEDLLTLPGVGRYTAGAVSSIVFGERAPIADGNVARVLLRVEGEPMEHGAPATMAWTWDRAERLVRLAKDPGAFNEGLMELGATVCTPRNPRCDACPLARRCRARATGMQASIPAPKRRTKREVAHHAAVVVRDGAGRLLVERRPASGLWAGMWQPPTVETSGRAAGKQVVARAVGLDSVRRREEFVFLTTHREVRFTVWDGTAGVGWTPGRGVFRSRKQLERLALGTPQRRVLLGIS